MTRSRLSRRAIACRWNHSATGGTTPRWPRTTRILDGLDCVRTTNMPSPFPGMDPYLEDPALWPDVHHALIEMIRETLVPRVRPKYLVRVEQRVYLNAVDDPAYRVLVPDLRIVETGRRRRPKA